MGLEMTIFLIGLIMEREILLCYIANLHIPKNLENAPAQVLNQLSIAGKSR